VRIYAGNADLLVDAVTILPGEEREGLEREGLEMKGLEVEIREELIEEIANLPP
jgi:hypothetical protein